MIKKAFYNKRSVFLAILYMPQCYWFFLEISIFLAIKQKLCISLALKHEQHGTKACLISKQEAKQEVHV